MALGNLGQVMFEAWEAALEEQARREREQVTSLSDWRKRRNGVWMDEGWMHGRPLSGKWLSEHFLEVE